MKIVVGVDTGRSYKAALNLAARLKFENPTWALAHSVDVAVPIGGFGFSAEEAFAIDYIKFANDIGQEALDEAKDDACAHGIIPETALLVGDGAAALIQYAEDVHADLVCVHSERKGRLGSMFLGSVSRGIAIGAKHSVLIAKGRVAPRGQLNAVFATDHSEYADQALDKFVSMQAKGIKSIRVVSAFEMIGSAGHFGDAAYEEQLGKWLKEEAERKTKHAVERLRQAGYVSTGKVVDKPVNEAINDAMKATQADLLIMGAQGHGFMHRLILGSTSLHQVVVEPHPVLIVRP